MREIETEQFLGKMTINITSRNSTTIEGKPEEKYNVMKNYAI